MFKAWLRSEAANQEKPSICDARWAIENPRLREYVFQQGTARTRGQIGDPKPFADFNNMRGQPVWEKLMRYAPIEDIGRCEPCAKLFIIAENEELFDNKDHAIAAHDRATGVKKLVSVNGIKHYGIYNEKRARISSWRSIGSVSIFKDQIVIWGILRRFLRPPFYPWRSGELRTVDRDSFGRGDQKATC